MNTRSTFHPHAPLPQLERLPGKSLRIRVFVTDLQYVAINTGGLLTNRWIIQRQGDRIVARSRKRHGLQTDRVSVKIRR